MVEIVLKRYSSLSKLKRVGEFTEKTYRKKKSGERIPVDIHAFPISIDEYNTGYYVIYRDITELKDKESEHEKIKDKYKGVFNNEFTVMIIIDPKTGKIIDANPAVENFYGWATNILTNKNKDINTMDNEEIEKEMKRAKSKEKLYFDFKHKTAFGDIKNVEVYSQPIKFGNEQHLFSIVHDVTDKKKVERELRNRREKFRLLLNKIETDINSSLANNNNAI